MTKLLLTLSQSDNQNIIKNFNLLCKAQDLRYKLDFIDSPLVELVPLGLHYSDIRNYTNIIITNNTVGAMVITCLKKYEFLKTIGPAKRNIWIVGYVCESLFQNNIFVIRHTAPNIENLLSNIPKNLYNDTIFLSSGEDEADKLPLQIKKHIVCKTIYARHLSNVDVEKDNINYIFLHSERCARILVNLLDENNLLAHLKDIIVIAINTKIEEIIKPFVKQTISPTSETIQGMIELLIQNIAGKN